MRDDQLKKLKQLGEKLADLVLDEADPAQWPGGGRPGVDLSHEERGERGWCQKNAAATLGLAIKVQALMEKSRKPAAGKAQPPNEEVSREIALAEQEARRILSKSTRRHAAGK